MELGDIIANLSCNSLLWYIIEYLNTVILTQRCHSNCSAVWQFIILPLCCYLTDGTCWRVAVCMSITKAQFLIIYPQIYWYALSFSSTLRNCMKLKALHNVVNICMYEWFLLFFKFQLHVLMFNFPTKQMVPKLTGEKCETALTHLNRGT